MNYLLIGGILFGGLPILTGFFSFNFLNKTHKVFLFFLSFGFTIDVLSFLFYEENNMVGLTYLFNIYSLVEAIFFIGYLAVVSRIIWLKRYKYYLFIGFTLFWIFVNLILGKKSAYGENMGGMFEMSYMLVVSALSVAAILNWMEEKEKLTLRPDFWFSLGIFFYCFSVFFLFILRNNPFINKIWFAHNLINFIATVLFIAGFTNILILRKEEAKKQAE